MSEGCWCAAIALSDRQPRYLWLSSAPCRLLLPTSPAAAAVAGSSARPVGSSALSAPDGTARARFCLDGGCRRAVPLAVAQLAVLCTHWRLGNAVLAPRAAAALKSAELRQNTTPPHDPPCSGQLTPGALNNPSCEHQQHRILLRSGSEPRL